VGAFFANASEQIAAAPRILFDLRASKTQVAGNASSVFQSAGLNFMLPATDIAAPPMRRRIHTWFLPQRGSVQERDWGSRFSPAFSTDPFSGTYLAPENPRDRQIGFLIDKHSSVPGIAWALRRANQAVIVFEGDSAEASGPAEAFRVQLTADFGRRCPNRRGR
jgi:hypothetical protein